MQQAVSLSLRADAAIARAILTSLRMHGANFAPKCIRSAARGPSQKEAGSSHSTWLKRNLMSIPYFKLFNLFNELFFFY